MTPQHETDSAVFATPRSQARVHQPSSRWTMALGVMGALIVGGAVFNSLSNARQAKAEVAPAAAPIARPAPAAAPAMANAPVIAEVPMQPAPMLDAPMMAQPAMENPEARYLAAPAVVVDLGGQTSAGSPPAQRNAGLPPTAEDNRMSADERFAARVSAGSAQTARATRLRNMSETAAQGTVISGVLETAINSDLPGSVRAVVSRDVYGFDGSRVLIPRGSKLIGQYKSAAAVGQTRAFVIWSRIITPQGVSIDVDSPATDRLGRGGLDGETNTHFFRRFGAAILLSVMSTGLDAVANHNGGGSNTFVIGSPVQASRVAEIALQKQIDIPATIKVAQGAPLQVFVSRDLDFSGVM